MFLLNWCEVHTANITHTPPIYSSLNFRLTSVMPKIFPLVTSYHPGILSLPHPASRLRVHTQSHYYSFNNDCRNHTQKHGVLFFQCFTLSRSLPQLSHTILLRTYVRVLKGYTHTTTQWMNLHYTACGICKAFLIDAVIQTDQLRRQDARCSYF